MGHPNIQLDNTLNADLHSHSTHSDGTLTPEELALRAKEKGVELWALTDHDAISGVEHAAAAAHDIGLPFLTGVEISINFAKESVHIVGLGFDMHNTALANGLKRIREGRFERAQKMGSNLEKVGIKNAFEGALAYSGNPQTVSRTHFSRFLVEEGICKDNTEVFKKYLGKGKPGYVAHAWANLQECLAWIHDAGGMAIIAHPGRYKDLSQTQHHALLTEFCASGGQGVEVITGSHSPEDATKYTRIAKDFNLLASRGSDFHCPNESRIDLGILPSLANSLEPVWKHLAHRILY